MRAYVKATNGVFANVNFYLAWEAFNQMGYEVVLFEEKDIDTLDITPETPVFAGVTIFKRIVDKLGVGYKPFDCYPEVLKPYYGRTLTKSTLGVERAKFHKDYKKVFVKPVLPKQFIGNVWESILNTIPLAKIPDDAEVWVCEPMDIVSEVRCYVLDGEILGVKHYYGDWSEGFSKSVIEEVVRKYEGAPAAYGIDFAVVRHNKGLPPSLYSRKPGEYRETIVLEVNDGCNLGNYGLDSIHYGEMIVSRWYEIMGGDKMKESLGQQIVDEMKRRSAYSVINDFAEKHT